MTEVDEATTIAAEETRDPEVALEELVGVDAATVDVGVLAAERA